jgi:hypothetical protein
MCYPYRPALRLSPVAAQSLYASSHDDAYRWTTLSEELHPASLPTQDAFLGYRWSYSGSAIVRTCSRDWTMMKRTRTALATDEPHASCRTIGSRLGASNGAGLEGCIEKMRLIVVYTRQYSMYSQCAASYRCRFTATQGFSLLTSRNVKPTKPLGPVNICRCIFRNSGTSPVVGACRH